jgi:hypothetical protein
MSTNVDALYEIQMKGDEIPQEPILIDASFFMNFILANHEHFEGLSVQSAVEHIVGRGKAEIERQIKTTQKTRENKVYGDLARKYNLTLEQAQAVLSAAALKASQEK